MITVLAFIFSYVIVGAFVAGFGYSWFKIDRKIKVVMWGIFWPLIVSIFLIVGTIFYVTLPIRKIYNLGFSIGKRF